MLVQLYKTIYFARILFTLKPSVSIFFSKKKCFRILIVQHKALYRGWFCGILSIRNVYQFFFLILLLSSSYKYLIVKCSLHTVNKFLVAVSPSHTCTYHLFCVCLLLKFFLYNGLFGFQFFF